MTYWEGMNIVKSVNNDFNWKGADSALMKLDTLKRTQQANKFKYKNLESKSTGLVKPTQRKISA